MKDINHYVGTWTELTDNIMSPEWEKPSIIKEHVLFWLRTYIVKQAGAHRDYPERIFELIGGLKYLRNNNIK